MSRISSPSVSSEPGLVAASRQGDDRAFEELYVRYRERIFSFILSKVHDHGRAEDIAQDVFMSALRRLRASDQPISFKPWIYEIAKNACIDEFRRGNRAREVPLEADGECVVDHQAAAVSAVPTPPAAVESKQRLNDLRGAFGGLSASHHQLLVMREFEGLSYDEIGERLDMTRQMVESSLFRARRKLAEEYQELASGQRCQQIQTAIEEGRLRSLSGLGIRDRRRFARHLSHCQPCRHVALAAGVDETLVKPRSIAAKIAALLPFPLWRLPWRSGAGKASRAGGSHQMAGASSAGLAGSAGSAITFGQAAATVAVIVAGAGGGFAVNSLASNGHSHAPAAANAARHSVRSTAASSSTGAGAPSAAHGHAVLRPGAASAPSIRPRAETAARPASSRRQRGPASGGGGAGSGSTPVNAGGSAGSGAAGAVKNTTNGLTSAANGVTKTVNGVTKTGVTKTVNGVANTVGKTVNGVANTVGKTLSGVTNTVGQTVNGATNTVSKTVNGAANTVGSTVNGATNTVSKPVNGVANTVGGTVNGATNTVSKTVGGVTHATGTATTPAGQAVNGTANTAAQAVGGATNGVTQTPKGVTKTAGKTVGGATGGLSKTVSGVPGGHSKTMSGVPGGLSGASGGSTGSSSPPSNQTATSGLQQAGPILGH